MENQYNKLAEIYDYLMEHVDYEAWVNYVEEIMTNFHREGKKIVDVACGTGNTTLPFARRGYHAVGIDISQGMLAKARQKAINLGLEVDFLEQDMRELQVDFAADIITCYQDGLNYLLSSDELVAVFKRVKENLSPQGLFIFDLNAVEKLQRSPGEITVIDEERMTLIWENNYDSDLDIWEIQLTGFIKKEEVYEKFKEVHQEKAYQTAEIANYLKEANLRLLGVYHAFTLKEASNQTRRLCYVAEPMD
ncbi:MAG: class I SAM-dependent methyltransferase [Bacillota bacterium]|nr:class I SAM-dependent methyltransferase [Bacillota bacterium]